MKKVTLEILDCTYTLLVLLVSLLIFLLLMLYNLFKFGPKVVYRWFNRRFQASPGASQVHPKTDE